MEKEHGTSARFRGTISLFNFLVPDTSDTLFFGKMSEFCSERIDDDNDSHNVFTLQAK